MIDAYKDHASVRLGTALIPVGVVLAVLWGIFAVDTIWDLHLYRFGTLPRDLNGLLGVVASPFLHADLEHITGNSLSMLVLGWLLVYFYPKLALRVVLACWFIGGLCVWALGRPNFHIGASGVIYGLAAFLFLSGLLRRHLAHSGLSFMVIALYGSWIWGVLPFEARISWEGHLLGGMVGAIMAVLYRHVAPLHVPAPVVLADDEVTPEDVTAYWQAPPEDPS